MADIPVEFSPPDAISFEEEEVVLRVFLALLDRCGEGVRCGDCDGDLGEGDYLKPWFLLGKHKGRTNAVTTVFRCMDCVQRDPKGLRLLSMENTNG